MSSINKIAKSYDRVADDYFNQIGLLGLSEKALKKFLKLLPGKAKVLDVGCGGGQDSKFLANQGCSVTGIDISKEMIKIAKKYAPEAVFLLADLMELPASKKYDGIWCCRVFHHISLADQTRFIKKLKVLLKKNGILYLTAFVSDQKIDYEAFDSGEDKLLKKRLTAKSFKSLLSDNGFEIIGFKYWEGKRGMEVFARKIEVL